MTATASTLTAGRGPVSVMLAALALLGLSCNSLTSVDAPDILQPSQLDTPDGANVLRVGAISNFYYFGIFYPFGDQGTVGVLSDELVSGGSDGTQEALDARRLTTDAEFTYYTMHQSRHNFEAAIAAYQKFPQLPRDYMGELFALLALDEDYLGEVMCSGVPLSEIVNGQPQYGPQLTTEQMFQHALGYADSGVKYAVDTVRYKYLAQVVRARVLLNQGQFDAAAAAVSGVPTSFLFNAEATLATLNQYNLIGLNQVYGKFYGVADKEGTNGLDFISSGDPRIVPNIADLGLGADGLTKIYEWLPYGNLDSPVSIANGIEARLIEAEAALQRGDATTWFTTLNTLRTDGTQTGGVYNPGTGGVAGLAPLADPGTAALRVDLTFRERAFWLFFQGHRLGDLRRLIRQYGRSQDTVFPIGPYKNSGSYGTDVNVAVPSGENNNPNFHGCLDRGA